MATGPHFSAKMAEDSVHTNVQVREILVAIKGNPRDHSQSQHHVRCDSDDNISPISLFPRRWNSMRVRSFRPIIFPETQILVRKYSG
jgi:hypothetical protein